MSIISHKCLPYQRNETSFSEGLPHTVQTDEGINFDAKSLDEDSLFSDIRWSGYISFPHAGLFDFEVTGIAGNCKVWIGDETIIDSKDKNASGIFSAAEHILYEVKIEYSHDTNILALKLFWSSRKMPRHIVPSSNLFSSTEPIRGSPFDLIVEPS